MTTATERASWRIFVSTYVLDEFNRVMTEQLGFSARFAAISRRRIVRRASMVESGASRHRVPDDVKDTPILHAALDAGVDYLVTNDRHLLDLNPYEGLRIVSMAEYHDILVAEGLIRRNS